MIDIKLIREEGKKVKSNYKKRNNPELLKKIDDILNLDKKNRKLQYDLDQLRHGRNEISREIAKFKQEKKDVSKLLKKANSIPSQIEKKEQEKKKINEEVNGILQRLPNILHESVPIGKDENDNVPAGVFGKKPKIKGAKSHIDIINELNLVDMDRAAKISGSRFYFLKGDLVLLDMALQAYAVDFMQKNGFLPVSPPYMMRKMPYQGVTDMQDFENVMYKIEGEDLYLIATSEHPLTAMFMDEILEEKDLPIKLAGISPCFRKEAGSHGRDTKGIFRVHHFNKIEQIVVCKPEDSWKHFDVILKNAVQFFESLGLHGRIMNICTGDIGVVAAKKIDIDIWMPAQQEYRELVSCSNCTDYQARSLKIRYRTPEKNAFAHTLNSTCVATSRALVAILENFYDDNKKEVTIPKVLVKYMNGKTKLTKYG